MTCTRPGARAGRPTGAPPARRPRLRGLHRPRLCALAVYLLVFQHVPVERCRLLLSDIAGAEVSAGFIHSCLEKAASMAAGTVKLIKALLIAARVVGFDETTLRSGAAGEKKFVHGAFTERFSLFRLGARSPETMTDFGILTDFTGIAVTDRDGNYFHATWKNISGHQACVQHLLRDLQDCAETYPGTIWPAQAQDALRKLIHARNQASDQAWTRSPPPSANPSSCSSAAPSPSHSPAFPASPAPGTAQTASRQGHAQFCRDREADVLRFTTDTGVWPTNNISESGLRSTKTQQKISGRLTSDNTTQDRLDVRSYIDTARKHGCDVLDVLHRLSPAAPGHPRLPATPDPRTTLPGSRHLEHIKSHSRHMGECLLAAGPAALGDEIL